MRILHLGIIVAGLLMTQLSVADIESEKEAEKLLSKLEMEGTIEQTLNQMVEFELQQNPALVPFKTVMLQFFNEYMSWESLKPEMVKIYSEAFSVQELRDINAFYETETGKKTIKLLPQLAVEVAKIGDTRVQANIDKLEEMIKAEVERLEKLNE